MLINTPLPLAARSARQRHPAAEPLDRARFWLCALFLPWLTGCVHLGLPDLALMPPVAAPAPTVVGAVSASPERSAEVDLDAEWASGPPDVFRVKPVGAANVSASLPQRQIRHLSFAETGFYDAMVMLLESSGLALAIEGGLPGRDRPPTLSLFNLSGSLAEVLDRVSEQAGLFYEVRGNTVVFTPQASFVIELPAVLAGDSTDALIQALQRLGAHDVHLDRLDRTLVFKADPRSLTAIRAYMSSLRERRSLLLYDVEVYQVDLPEQRPLGIAWDGLRLLEGAGGAPGLARASLSQGAAVRGEALQPHALLSFLQSQGTVKALSTPRIAMIAGGRGQMRIGQSTTYVSKLGRQGSGGGADPVAVETQTLNTGFELTLVGDEQDGAVLTRIAVNLSDILSYNQSTVMGTQLRLPQTAQREVKTMVTAQPGDVILLAGIFITRNHPEARQGIAAWLRPAEPRRSELVLALRPRVVPWGQARASGQGVRSASRDAVSSPPSAQVAASPPQLSAVLAVTAPVASKPRSPASVPAEANAPAPSLSGLLGDLAAFVSSKSTALLRPAAAAQVQP